MKKTPLYPLICMIIGGVGGLTVSLLFDLLNAFVSFMTIGALASMVLGKLVDMKYKTCKWFYTNLGAGLFGSALCYLVISLEVYGMRQAQAPGEFGWLLPFMSFGLLGVCGILLYSLWKDNQLDLALKGGLMALLLSTLTCNITLRVLLQTFSVHLWGSETISNLSDLPIPPFFPYLVLFLFAFLGYEVGRTVTIIGRKIQVARSSHRIKELEREANNQKALVKKMKTEYAKLETEIQHVVAADPANLMVKIDELRSKIQSLAMSEVTEELASVSQESQRTRQMIKGIEDEMSARSSERETLSVQLRTIEKQLQKAEAEDPANIKVRLQVLNREWKGLNESDLKATPAHGEVARLFKKQLLLERQIRAKNLRIKTLKHQIEEIRLGDWARQLKKLILEQKEKDEKLELARSKLSQTQAELGKLRE